MNRIELMDCTLRDGGWVNDFEFGDQISFLTGKLEEAGIRFLELGYMDETKGSVKGRSLYRDFEALKQNGLAGSSEALQLLMIDYGKFPAEKIPEKTAGTENPVDGIRLCFHKKDLLQAAVTGRRILEKGYRLYLQPMVTTRYSDDELKRMIDLFQKECAGLSAFYIVDSFGVMKEAEIQKRLLLADSCLDTEILLGLHAHNNLSLSFANARAACRLLCPGEPAGCFSPGRRISIDATMMGIGKGAGNLRTEEFAAYLNREAGQHFDIEKLKRLREEVFVPLRQRCYWGYCPEFELTSRYRATPTYAKFFVQENGCTLAELESFLASMDEEKKDSFYQEYALNALAELRKDAK